MRAIGAVVTLGALPPSIHEAMQSRISQLEALQQQVVGDIILTGRQGADITEHQNRANAMTNDIAVLKSEIDTIDEGTVPTWQSSAQKVYDNAIQQLKDLADLRQKTATRGAYSGLAWGLLTAAAVAGIGYGIWRYKKRRR